MLCECWTANTIMQTSLAKHDTHICSWACERAMKCNDVMRCHVLWRGANSNLSTQPMNNGETSTNLRTTLFIRTRKAEPEVRVLDCQQL